MVLVAAAVEVVEQQLPVPAADKHPVGRNSVVTFGSAVVVDRMALLVQNFHILHAALCIADDEVVEVHHYPAAVADVAVAS